MFGSRYECVCVCATAPINSIFKWANERKSPTNTPTKSMCVCDKFSPNLKCKTKFVVAIMPFYIDSARSYFIWWKCTGYSICWNCNSVISLLFFYASIILLHFGCWLEALCDAFANSGFFCIWAKDCEFYAFGWNDNAFIRRIHTVRIWLSICWALAI